MASVCVESLEEESCVGGKLIAVMRSEGVGIMLDNMKNDVTGMKMGSIIDQETQFKKR